ncbi:hypothetical protein HPP92_026154 [Vanilla planifolia]|uniref:Uncharacterized protein n=1 Tax=Vanilla planifolia TaxID=51239 RepID=A0A835PE31_VANPL|nr:hypothetical protein HPP92_026154 [Vanilla planifolia]
MINHNGTKINSENLFPAVLVDRIKRKPIDLAAVEDRLICPPCEKADTPTNLVYNCMIDAVMHLQHSNLKLGWVWKLKRNQKSPFPLAGCLDCLAYSFMAV